MAGAAIVNVVARRWVDAVEVRGSSMAPTLLPGDRLIVEALSYRSRLPRSGEIALAADPREPARELVKRVALVDAADATLELVGDSAAESTDSRMFGPVPVSSVRWRVAARYWPLHRVGIRRLSSDSQRRQWRRPG